VAQANVLIDGVGSVDFGSVTVGSSGVAKTFTITNNGTGALTGVFITKDGPGAADYNVTPPTGTTVPAGSGSVTFTVTFAPTASGPRNAALHISSNVTGAKNPFDIALTAIGQTVFQSWASANSEANDPNAVGKNGVKNLLNFAFNVNPAGGTSGSLFYAGTFAGGGTIASIGQPTTRREGTDIRALFTRRKDFENAGLLYVVQFSGNLSSWIDSTATPTVLADDGTTQIVSVPYPPGSSLEGFFRVRTTLTQ
jgi:hypothetical protein